MPGLLCAVSGHRPPWPPRSHGGRIGHRLGWLAPAHLGPGGLELHAVRGGEPHPGPSGLQEGDWSLIWGLLEVALAVAISVGAVGEVWEGLKRRRGRIKSDEGI